jgi:hypothetical protein
MTLLFVVLASWILLTTLVAGLCMAARRGEETPATAQVTPTVRPELRGSPMAIGAGQRLESARRRGPSEPATTFARADGVAA